MILRDPAELIAALVIMGADSAMSANGISAVCRINLRAGDKYRSIREAMMSYLERVVLAVVVSACILPTAFAAEANGDAMLMFKPDGKMASMPLPDKATLDMMMKHAVEVNSDMVVLVWGSKTYMIKNEKMPDGKMMFDVWGIHFEK
jgi:hypothetical protein